MIRRLLLGLVLGVLAGGAIAFGLVRSFGLLSFPADGALLAYAAAAVTGVVTGLIAGRPFWAKGALIESLLKAVVGALVSAFGMFALRTWAGGVTVPMEWLDPAMHGPLATLPAASLPLIGGAMGGLFGLDNTDPPADTGKPRLRAEKGPRVAIREKGDEAEDLPEVESPEARRRR